MEGTLELRGRAHWQVEWAGIRGHTGREGALRGGELENTLGW